MAIDIQEGYIYIFNSDPSMTDPEKRKAIVEPFVHMVPKILKQSGMFDLLLKVREEAPRQYS